MKKLSLILSVFLFIIGKSYCQYNIIDYEKNKLWYVISGSIAYNGNENDTCCLKSEVLKLGDNVTLNDTIYSTIYKAEVSTLTDWELIGYIREESKKAYYMPLSKNSEYLLYDFNLEISSKIHITNPLFGNSDSIEYTVSKIDTVVFDSEKRKRITLSGSNQEIWIEGLGSLNGLIYSGLLIDGGFKNLTCYLENGNTIYKNPDCNYCFYTSTGILDKKKDDFLIYPNPTTGSITLNDMNNSIFYLYNLSGELLLQQNINNNTYLVDVSNQKNGIYLYQIQQNNTYIKGKLILNHK